MNDQDESISIIIKSKSILELSHHVLEGSREIHYDDS